MISPGAFASEVGSVLGVDDFYRPVSGQAAILKTEATFARVFVAREVARLVAR
jgi:hypothetical protein